MGKGDSKSKKGKIFKGSSGVTRPKKSKNNIVHSKAQKSSEKKE